MFVHGCFWHRHGCERATRELPKSNRRYWETKFQLNVERDQRKVRTLEALRWRVMTMWECAILRNPADAASKVMAEKRILRVSLESKKQSR